MYMYKQVFVVHPNGMRTDKLVDYEAVLLTTKLFNWMMG